MKGLLILTLVTLAPLAAQVAHADEPAGPAPAATPATTTASASTAVAEKPAESEGETVQRGLSLGLRTGFTLPMGSVAAGGGSSLSDAVTGQIPIWLDVGYLINPHIYVGGYFQFGIVLPNNCPNGASCSANDLRFGADFHYHILPDKIFDPWVGGGIGYEILNTSESAGAISASGSVSGFEFFNLQAGGDYKVTPAFGIGPFIGMTFAQYSSASSNGNSVPINQTALHEWFYLGVRGVYDIAM